MSDFAPGAWVHHVGNGYYGQVVTGPAPSDYHDEPEYVVSTPGLGECYWFAKNLRSSTLNARELALTIREQDS
jgi:hypothetical protein